MRLLLFAVGAVMALIGIGILSNNTFGDGPGGVVSTVDDGASILDSLLWFAGAAGAFLWGAVWKREKESSEQWKSRALSEPSSDHAATAQDPPVGRPVIERHEPAASRSQVTVYGYSEVFAVNPTVKVLWNGSEVGTVGRGGTMRFHVSSDGEIVFKSSIRTARLPLRVGTDAHVKLSWSRTSGKLSAMRVDPTKLGL